LAIQTAISALRSWATTTLGANLNLGWGRNVFDHLLRLPDDYFLRRHLGDVVSRFGSIDIIQRTLTTRAVSAVMDGALGAVTLVVVLAYSPRLAAIAMGGIALYAAIRIASFQTLKQSNLESLTATAQQQTLFLEALRAASTIRLNNKRRAMVSRYMDRAVRASNMSLGVQSLSLTFDSAASLAMGATRIFIVLVGAKMTLAGNFTAGMLVAFLAYADQFGTRIMNMIDFVVQLQILRMHGDRLSDIVFTPRELHESGTKPLPENDFALSIVGMTFRYGPRERPVLFNCSVNIADGESVAIMGQSGCGKSTLMKLLAGSLEAERGQILLGGVDVREIGKERYRSLIGAVLQDDCVMSGSILENISFFDTDWNMDQVTAAAKSAGLHRDVMAMPMKYHTLIGDMGSSLSGGQKQRIILARALYRRPKILLLDEATSHLDVDSEKEIRTEIDRLQITRIIVAHRPETVRSASRVFVFKDGRLWLAEATSAVAELRDEMATDSAAS
jgi:ATP-binding cassette subfamily B protein RaxB